MECPPHTNDQEMLEDAKNTWGSSPIHFKDVLKSSAAHFEVVGSNINQQSTMSEMDLYGLAVNSIKTFLAGWSAEKHEDNVSKVAQD